MILSREQINRYLRHIIIPEISGKGQKKVIESNIFIFAGDVINASYLIYYLAASGVGSISCCFIDSSGYEKLFENIRDLNDECKIELIHTRALKNESFWTKHKDITLSAFLFEGSEALRAIGDSSFIEVISKFTPIIISLYDGWIGFIQFIDKAESINELCSRLKSINNLILDKTREEGNIFSSGLLGAITAIEALKFILEIGSNCEKPLYFNLLKMEFKRDMLRSINDIFLDKRAEEYDNVEKKILKPAYDLGRYNLSKTLKDCKVLIVGTGGLGSPAALSIARAGVGTIGLVDFDSVEISNLNRQILHSASRIGMPKVESAEIFIKNTYKDINIIKYNMILNKNNVMEIIKEYDLVIDGVDNFPARYLLNDACFLAGKPMIEAGAVRFTGLNMTILPGVTTCYRCLFPNIPEKGSIQSCSEVGVLGPVPGVIGFIQGAEAYKLLTGSGELLVNRIMYLDALDLEFDVIGVDKTAKCKLCGESPAIKELMEYEFCCEITSKHSKV